MPDCAMQKCRQNGPGADDEGYGRCEVRQLNRVVLAQEVEASACNACAQEQDLVAPAFRPHPLVAEWQHQNVGQQKAQYHNLGRA